MARSVEDAAYLLVTTAGLDPKGNFALALPDQFFVMATDTLPSVPGLAFLTC